ncbi:hypothetical protein OF001_U40044 [Pseudomonas sp. OF001]|nr:hypothetical protein OF001_U40044 [Pseudomonas sp. OF001]
MGCGRPADRPFPLADFCSKMPL